MKPLVLRCVLALALIASARAQTADAPPPPDASSPSLTVGGADDEFSTRVLPPPPSSPKRAVPVKFGDTSGDVWIGRRTVVDRYAGWGWIKKGGQPWSGARWAMIEEDPPRQVAPGRFLSRPTADNHVEYKLYGEWAGYQGYEPNYDVFVDVFRIRGFEVVGPAEPVGRRPPRASASTESRYSERGANTPRRHN